MASLPSFAQAFSSIPGPASPQKHSTEDPAPAPPPPHKRRRVTISGAPAAPPLVTAVPPVPPDTPSSTPISPVVMGLTLAPDNPLAVEKVKSMISLKQKQVALIQQRRGSAAGNLSPTPDPNPRPPPSPIPPPSLPISFARRRAEQLGSKKKKPADILIRPRDAHLQPAIQSAPPQSLGRFPMALPRLPPALARPDSAIRRVATAVPPTPTTLARHRAPLRPSPPTASVPIAATLIPTTPAQPLDKAAFLAPFELFYDALNDSKQLKSWLADQLHRSDAILQQHDNLNDLVDSLVQKQLAPMRHDIIALQRRVDQLEDALRLKHRSTRPSLRNGVSTSPMPPDAYTFPPPSSAGLEPSLSSRRTDRDPPIIVTDDDTDPPEPTPAPRRIDPSRSLPLEPPPPPRLSPRTPFDHALTSSSSSSSSPKLKSPADHPSLTRRASDDKRRLDQ